MVSCRFEVTILFWYQGLLHPCPVRCRQDLTPSSRPSSSAWALSSRQGPRVAIEGRNFASHLNIGRIDPVKREWSGLAGIQVNCGCCFCGSRCRRCCSCFWCSVYLRNRNDLAYLFQMNYFYCPLTAKQPPSYSAIDICTCSPQCARTYTYTRMHAHVRRNCFHIYMRKSRRCCSWSLRLCEQFEIAGK